MIDQYDEAAKKSGAIMIPTNGFESAPSDLLTWSMATKMKREFGVKVKDVVLSIYDLKGAGISGGTAASILAAFSNLSFAELRSMSDPYRISVSRPSAIPSTPLYRKLVGVHNVRDIGTVTTAVPAACDTAIVHRSSSLMPNLYDRNFHFQEFAKVRNVFIGFAVHMGLGLIAISLMLPPIRWLARKLLPEPGQGPKKQDTLADHVEYRGIATADPAEPGKKPIRLSGKLSYQGPAYPMTGMLLAESAMVLITSKKVGKDIKGGYLTPATLGEEYITRIERCGVEIEMHALED
ncbi:predicted protein [Uncinocarpus reesii 1704]|uniref:Saccharopine dehydrogenase-like C-terminal domain-containing protein n=1 Tax=Uncinocarpus reesii (strain UAMH 1704) TaxID=336963 RepID=C4JUS7_UNCRE|nr:uncharacterized protein UREG_04880 [Uncinocarpus reesii 1704]EEP80038.1 predicted protein [Uncinocarpus reesii 1704]